MLGNYFKKKFGKEKEVPAAEQFYSPLRIGLHSTLTINTVDWLTMVESLNKMFTLPSSDLTVLAIGETIQDKAKIFQIYMEDQSKTEFMLQLFCNKDAVSEATLFKQVVSIVPLTEEEWDENMDGIGGRIIELDGIDYERVWGENHEGKLDLVQFDEKIIEYDNDASYTNNYLLYGRKFESILGGEESEMLLVGVEESDETAEITMMLGLPVPLQNINVQ